MDQFEISDEYRGEALLQVCSSINRKITDNCRLQTLHAILRSGPISDRDRSNALRRAAANKNYRLVSEFIRNSRISNIEKLKAILCGFSLSGNHLGVRQI